MNYLFLNVAVAQQYGINVSLLLGDFVYWDNINKSNQSAHHFRDGRYWIYYSRSALAKHIKVLTERQVQCAIDKMIDEGLIVKAEANYNKNGFDQTSWYSITEKGLKLFVQSIEQNVQSIDTKQGTSIEQNVQPIPNNNPKEEPITTIDLGAVPAHGNINATPVPTNRVRPDCRPNIPDGVREGAWQQWYQLISEHELEFTNKELSAIKAYAYSHPRLQPHEIKATLTMIYGWASDDGLDIADSLTRSLNTKSILQATMRKESDTNGQRIYDINKLNWIREQRIKQEKQGA